MIFLKRTYDPRDQLFRNQNLLHLKCVLDPIKLVSWNQSYHKCALIIAILSKAPYHLRWAASMSDRLLRFRLRQSQSTYHPFVPRAAVLMHFITAKIFLGLVQGHALVLWIYHYQTCRMSVVRNRFCKAITHKISFSKIFSLFQC